MKTVLITLTSVLIATAIIAAPKKPKPQLFVPMDYSTCGYHASEQPLPDVSVAAYVEWQAGDCSSLIQQAIDHVSALSPDKDGHRGAVLLGEGTFRIDQPLRIGASGVVLRGMGRDKTRLVKHGTDRGAMLYIEGVPGKGGIPRKGVKRSERGVKRSERDDSFVSDTLFITADLIPAGSKAIPIPLSQTSNLKPQTSNLKSQTSNLKSQTSNLIVSNPPYILQSEAATMEQHVLQHEPHQALFVPDDDPLLFYRAISDFALTALKPGGQLFLEINPHCADALCQLLQQKSYSVEQRRDQYGKTRFIKAQRP